MNIKLYKNYSDNRVLDKNLTNELIYENVKLKDNTSIIDPVFVIYDTNVNIYSYNYIYVEDFNRYYYINNINSIRNNLYELECHVDVLMSYKDNIKNCKCLEIRNSKDNNKYIVDNDVILDNDQEIKIQKFNDNDQLANYSGEMYYVLVVAGKSE